MKAKYKIIFYYTGIGKYAMNVLAGALMDDPRTNETDISFANKFDALCADIEKAQQAKQSILVNWSFFSAGFAKARRELKYLKQKIDRQNTLHIAGGVHATAEPIQTLKAGFDYLACGEGEQIIVDLVANFLQDKSLNAIRGLNYLIGENLSRNGRGETISLDDYPPHCARYKKFGPVEITRGCIYACKFCQTPFVNKARFRHRSIENIKRHVHTMHHSGLKDYRFLSPSSLSFGSKDESVNLPALEELLASVRGIIGSGKRLFYGTFPSEVRPEHLSPAVLMLLKKYTDNDNLIIGGQSGSQHMLDITHRGHNVEVIEQAVRYSLEYGFKPNVDFIFGMPGETEDDAHATRELMQRLADLGAKIHSHTFMPLPGTPFQNEVAGKVDPLTEKKLKTLIAQGRAYGRWKEQIQLSDNLVQLKKQSS